MRLFIISFMALWIFIWQPAAAQIINPDPDLDILWRQVYAQPEDFGVACMPLNSPGNAVFYNANQRFPLASVTKLMIFIEYARQLDARIISFDEMVEVRLLNRYDLPRTDRGAHEEFMRRYPANTRSLSLWDVAAIGMIQYSSNAASDYLLDRLGPVDWQTLYQTMGMTRTDYPHPLAVIAMLMNNHESGQATMESISSLSLEKGLMLFDRYVNDADWHREEVNYWSVPRRRSFPEWWVQAAILQQHTANGTPYDFINALSAIYGDNSILTPGAKNLLHQGLYWLGYAAIDNTYFEYGSKLGFYSGGVLTLVAYGYPSRGEPVVSAAFFRNIPRQVYYEMIEEDSIGLLAHWMNLNTCNGLTDRILAGR